MKITIKAKLILIGILFFISLAAGELFSSYMDRKIEMTTQQISLRQNQINLITEFQVTITELALAAMDAIVDRENGVVSEALKQEINKNASLAREILPKMSNLADTNDKNNLSRSISENYPQFEHAITSELTRLIAANAAILDYESIDDLIDQKADEILDAVKHLVLSVENENTEALETMNRQVADSSYLRRIINGALALTLGGALVLLARSILSPINAAKKMIKDIAEGNGDLTKRLAVERDEIGEFSNGFNIFVDKLHSLISQIQKNLTTLNASADQLSTLSGEVADGSEKTSGRSSTLAAATEQMSSNMNAVAAASEQASVNINMVASATEEMSATVSEIAGNTAKAREITLKAVTKTDSASQRMDQLGGAAQEISKVTETITEISEQTNLLALNATIEAARAGDAGKGFAVVANEIKELAKQTAEATLEIRGKIAAIQSSTDLTVSEMSEINLVINDVNEIVTTIATAVEEQSVSTSEIATNVAQAAQGISEVNENVSQSSLVAGEISQDIIEVSSAAEGLRQNGEKVNRQAGKLLQLADKLSNIVNQFKL